MVKVRIKGAEKQRKLLEARAKRLARQAVLDPKLANRIKGRLLLPIKKEGILPDGTKVKSFTVKWAKRRRKLSEVNKVSKFYRNFFSNLTFSGKFLNSFVSSVEAKGGKITYVIGPAGNHKGYKGLRGKKGKGASNEDIGKGQIDQGRDYRILSDKNRTMIVRLINGRIRRELKLKLKNL